MILNLNHEINNEGHEKGKTSTYEQKKDEATYFIWIVKSLQRVWLKYIEK